MKRTVQPSDPYKLRLSFPIDDRVPGWFFRVRELSPGAYLVDGCDRAGRVVAHSGDEPKELLEACACDAQDVQRQLVRFIDHEEFYQCVALLGDDLLAAGYPELDARLRDAMYAGCTAGEVLGALRNELRDLRGSSACSRVNIATRIDTFIRLLDSAL
jgi:hypothetical protein